MERLTKRDIDGCPFLEKDEGYLKLLARLDDYEDAEEQGLLIKLPCKVGDVVWWIPPLRFSWLEHRAYQCMVVSVTITENKKRERRYKYRIAELRDGKTTSDVRDIDFTDIGKTVFMTSKDAEDALAKETNVSSKGENNED